MKESAKKTGGPPPETDDEAAVAAIATIYQAERSDLGALLGHNLQLAGIGITYMGVVASLLFVREVAVDAPWLLAVAAPFPAWMVLAFMVTLLASVFAHNLSVDLLEKRLLDIAEWPREARPLIGAGIGDKVTNIATQPVYLRPQTLVAYGGVLLITLVFTLACLRTAEGAEGSPGLLLAWLFYGSLAALFFCAGILTVRRLNDHNSAWYAQWDDPPSQAQLPGAESESEREGA